MRRFYKTIFLIIALVCYSSVTFGQDSYQASVNEGFSLRVSGIVSPWKCGIITDKFVTGAGVDISATFGITENFAIFGSFEHLFNTKLDNKEVDFLIYTDKVKHQNLLAGLRYNGGSTSSRLRYNIDAGLVNSTSTVQIFHDQHDVYLDIILKGLGFHAGGGIEYFLTPFMSLDASAGISIGGYRSSEYLGISHAESLKWTSIRMLLGIHYHFAGR